MKLPKSKTTLALVWRYDITMDSETPIAVFKTHEAADNYSGACQQEMRDRGFTEFFFGVSGIIYYDE